MSNGENSNASESSESMLAIESDSRSDSDEDIHSEDGEALYRASGRGDLTEMERLLDDGVDVNYQNDVCVIYYIRMKYTAVFDITLVFYSLDGLH